jgi:hypothetical protein
VNEGRPRYETASDREEETRIGNILAKAWDCEIVKLPISYNLDYVAIRNKQIFAWLEIKRRHRTLDQYRCTFLSMQKVMTAHLLHSVTGLRCLFVVQFDDQLAFADMLTERTVEFRGRTDRGDWQDQEAAVAIAPDDFIPIKGEGR